MNEPTSAWRHFTGISARRRAVRDFDGGPLDDAAVREVLTEALSAPSSGNLQPYTIHRVREPGLKQALAEACEGQRAARSASELLVIVASPQIGRSTLEAQRAWARDTPSLSAESRAYHREQLDRFSKFLRFAPLAALGLFRVLLSAVRPARLLVPLGRAGMAHWASRSALYAAQHLMLAATARGFDTCPMEGFDPTRVTKLLRLPRGAVVPLVIALGHRTDDAHLEERWRRPLELAVVTH